MPYIYYRHLFASGPDRWDSLQVDNDTFKRFVDMSEEDIVDELIDKDAITLYTTYKYANDSYRGFEVVLKNPFLAQSKLILLRGLPGSGKSSLAEFLQFSMPSCVYYEADMFHVDKYGVYKFDANNLSAAHDWCLNKTEAAMRDFNYATVIVSNTFTEEWEMKAYELLAVKYKYAFVTLIAEHRHYGKLLHNVPLTTYDNMKQRFSVKL